MHTLAELVVPEGVVAIHWFEQNAYAFKGLGRETFAQQNKGGG